MLSNHRDRCKEWPTALLSLNTDLFSELQQPFCNHDRKRHKEGKLKRAEWTNRRSWVLNHIPRLLNNSCNSEIKNIYFKTSLGRNVFTSSKAYLLCFQLARRMPFEDSILRLRTSCNPLA